MRQHLLTALCSILCLAIVFSGAAPANARTRLPKIQSVTFGGKAGNYTATITGVHFGVAPGGIPCNACSPLQLQVVDLVSQPHQQTINVTAWSDKAITVTGIAAARGDALRIAVYNQIAGNVDAWGGRIGRDSAAPRIMSVVASGSGAALSITITGSGFGDAPPQVGQTTNSPFFVFTDYNAMGPGTDGFPWNAGFCGATDCNGVTLGYQSWTDTQIVISGFGSEYGTNYLANPGDAFCIGVWPSTSTSNGTTGGSYKCRHVPN